MISQIAHFGAALTRPTSWPHCAAMPICA